MADHVYAGMRDNIIGKLKTSKGAAKHKVKADHYEGELSTILTSPHITRLLDLAKKLKGTPEEVAAATQELTDRAVLTLLVVKYLNDTLMPLGVTNDVAERMNPGIDYIINGTPIPVS